MSVSTHVLDSTRGRPAAGVPVRLYRDGHEAGGGRTDADGRLRWESVGGAGIYRLVFEVGGYFAGHGVETFYPEVVITFRVGEDGGHCHVPLLLSPFAYSTYRGS